MNHNLFIVRLVLRKECHNLAVAIGVFGGRTQYLYFLILVNSYLCIKCIIRL